MANPKIYLLFYLLLLFSLFSSSSQSMFIYNGFNDSNLTVSGETRLIQTGALRLTNRVHNITGRAFYSTPIPMFNNSPNASSFTTHFVLQITTSTSNNGGYGLAFILSPTPRFPYAAPGHYLGVFNQSNDGNPSNHIFMVEFDTVNGYNETSDRESNHVGININGLDSKASRPAAYHVEGTQGQEEEIRLENDGPVQAWIDYDGFNKVVNVTISPMGVAKPVRPLLSLDIDLSPYLVENMYVGFSAATGEIASSHYILGWSFNLNGIADQLNISQLPVVPDEKLSSSKNNKLRTALIAFSSVVFVIFIGALVGYIFHNKFMRFEVLEEWELDCPHRFKYRDLHKATKGFQESERIGIGGFGSVYKGVLPANGIEVAVKKIRPNNPLQGMKEFAAEIECLGRLRHKNLVNLQGWCKHKNELLLIYDYVPNGSLDYLLYPDKKDDVPLTWEQRFNIIKGVTSGLLYLHEEWEQVVIHRDVKSSNVLIDHEMNAKLGDFGLARLYDHGKNSYTTNVVGTVGYLAPELSRMGKASTRTDVFAFGILLLEVVCGRAPVVDEANGHAVLADFVVECMQMGSIFDAVDEKMESKYVVEEVELVLELGLLCSHPKPEARPSMREVMKYLNGDELLPFFDKVSSMSPMRRGEIGSRLLSPQWSGSVTNTTSSSVATYQPHNVGTMSPRPPVMFLSE